MTGLRDPGGLQFLTVSEAAEALGLSRLRVREAVARGLLAARRDNEGHLRVDVAHGIDPAAGDPVPPDDLIALLFDEVEELGDQISAKDGEIVALTGLLERQDAALDAAGGALDTAEARATDLSALLDRALTHLEANADSTLRLQSVADRALTALDATGDDLEHSLAQSARFEALLTRALALAETTPAADDTLAPTADRAMDMLEAALARAEAGQQATERTGALLDRALSAGEQLQQDLADRDTAIAQQKTTIETALDMSERVVALAADAAAPPRRRGLFGWLFGT